MRERKTCTSCGGIAFALVAVVVVTCFLTSGPLVVRHAKGDSEGAKKHGRVKKSLKKASAKAFLSALPSPRREEHDSDLFFELLAPQVLKPVLQAQLVASARASGESSIEDVVAAQFAGTHWAGPERDERVPEVSRLSGQNHALSLEPKPTQDADRMIGVGAVGISIGAVAVLLYSIIDKLLFKRQCLVQSAGLMGTSDLNGAELQPAVAEGLEVAVDPFLPGAKLAAQPALAIDRRSGTGTKVPVLSISDEEMQKMAELLESRRAALESFRWRSSLCYSFDALCRAALRRKREGARAAVPRDSRTRKKGSHMQHRGCRAAAIIMSGTHAEQIDQAPESHDMPPAMGPGELPGAEQNASSVSPPTSMPVSGVEGLDSDNASKVRREIEEAEREFQEKVKAYKKDKQTQQKVIKKAKRRPVTRRPAKDKNPPENESWVSRRTRSLDRTRRALTIRQERQRQEEGTDKPQNFIGGIDFDSDPSTWLPWGLVALLAVANLLQAEGVIEKLQFVEQQSRLYGGDIGDEVINEVLEGSEFILDVSDVVGQTLTEIFVGPILLTSLELGVNEALARAIGRKFIPYLLVGEAGLAAITEVSAQELGSVIGEKLQPFAGAFLSAVERLT